MIFGSALYLWSQEFLSEGSEEKEEGGDKDGEGRSLFLRACSALREPQATNGPRRPWSAPGLLPCALGDRGNSNRQRSLHLSATSPLRRFGVSMEAPSEGQRENVEGERESWEVSWEVTESRTSTFQEARSIDLDTRKRSSSPLPAWSKQISVTSNYINF